MDATGARRVEIDGIDADADFLDQPQARRGGDVLRRDGPEHVPQDVGLAHQLGKAGIVHLVAGDDLDRIVRDLAQTPRDGRSGVVVEDHAHHLPHGNAERDGRRPP